MISVLPLYSQWTINFVLSNRKNHYKFEKLDNRINFRVSLTCNINNGHYTGNAESADSQKMVVRQIRHVIVDVNHFVFLMGCS